MIGTVVSFKVIGRTKVLLTDKRIIVDQGGLPKPAPDSIFYKSIASVKYYGTKIERKLKWGIIAVRRKNGRYFLIYATKDTPKLYEMILEKMEEAKNHRI